MAPSCTEVVALVSVPSDDTSHLRDAARVRALEDYRLLDPSAERRDLVALVELAARACGVPMATLNLITDTEQRQVASVGFEGGISARADSMCDVVLDDPEPVVLADASLDDRFRHNPWVTGETHVRLYATHQLRTPDAVPIGTLCVFDREPRTIDEERARRLADLADRVVDVLELELRTRQLADAVRRLEASQEELRRSNAELTHFAVQVSHDLRTPLATVVANHELLVAELADSRAAVRPDPGRAGAGRAPAGLGRPRRRADVEPGRGHPRPGGRGRWSARRRAGRPPGRARHRARRPRLPPRRRRPARRCAADGARRRAAPAGPVPEPGRERVEVTRPGVPAQVEVDAEPADGGWRVRVADHGPGFGAGDAARLLERLRRGDHAAGVDGAGVGLATCKRIADAHDGTLTLVETPGGGATVLVDLPG